MRPTPISFHRCCSEEGSPKGCRAGNQTRACRTSSRRFNIWATPHSLWATPHPVWVTPHPKWARHQIWASLHRLSYAAYYLSNAVPYLSYAAPHLSYASPLLRATPHPVWDRSHPIWATPHSQGECQFWYFLGWFIRHISPWGDSHAHPVVKRERGRGRVGFAWFIFI